MVGDFNVTLNMKERSDYVLGAVPSRKELDFSECIESLDLTDLQCFGAYFTWSNKRNVGFFSKKAG